MFSALFDLFRWIHILAGFTVMIVMWIPIFARKGGHLHNRTGWIFVVQMWTISVTALYMGVYRIFLEPVTDPMLQAFSWFLLLIGLLTFTTVFFGLRVLRFKKRKVIHHKWIDYILPILLIASSVTMMIYGAQIDVPLLQWFPIVGIMIGSGQLAYWLRVPRLSTHWICEHLGGMLGGCIAAITAFVVFGAPRLVQTEALHPIVWFIPTIIFTPVIIYYRIQQSRKGKVINRHA